MFGCTADAAPIGVSSSVGPAEQKLQDLGIHDAHVIVQIIHRGVQEVHVLWSPPLQAMQRRLHVPSARCKTHSSFGTLLQKASTMVNLLHIPPCQPRDYAERRQVSHVESLSRQLKADRRLCQDLHA